MSSNTSFTTTPKLKLFMVQLGGRAQGCLTELHDVVFAVGPAVEFIIPTLKQKWFGQSKRLHIDSVMEVRVVDGYRIRPIEKRAKEVAGPKLFFVNYGAYKKGIFGEFHEMQLFVGNNKKEVMLKAQEKLCLEMDERHCDDIALLSDAFDDVVEISTIDQYSLEIIQTNEADEITVDSKYYKL